MKTLSLDLYADLLEKRFEQGGRGPDGYDCLGLALEMARRLGKKLPPYVSSEEELHQQLGSGASTLADLPRAAKPEAGCVVLLRMTPDQHHIGVMIDDYRFLHASRQVGLVVERVLSPTWARKVIGYYRLEDAQ